MNNIYDNGAIMLGNVKMVKEEIKRQMEQDIDMCYSIDYWHEDDKVV